ncbi:MAG: ABC transporter permease [Chloroflexi bacterium]|nr:ABC transporter permease [Chloroflexota bacterium]
MAKETVARETGAALVSPVADGPAPAGAWRSGLSELLGGRWRPVIMAALSLLIFAALWQFASTFLVNPRLMPGPLAVLRAVGPMFASGEMPWHIGSSIARVVVGFTIATVSAIALGLLMGRLPLLNELTDPVAQLLRALSPTAMITIAIIWFGIGESSKYFLTFWGAFFLILFNTVAGSISTPLLRQRAARCLGASGFQVFYMVVLPSAIPYIRVGLRLGLTSAFISVIPAEMLAARSGVGYLLQQSAALMQTDRIFVALATLAILGLLADRGLNLVFRLFFARYTDYVGH